MFIVRSVKIKYESVLGALLIFVEGGGFHSHFVNDCFVWIIILSRFHHIRGRKCAIYTVVGLLFLGCRHLFN